jgi:catechol 2,3-dioxygenase-like lactoylglutathione lyase family enzyme
MFSPNPISPIRPDELEAQAFVPGLDIKKGINSSADSAAQHVMSVGRVHHAGLTVSNMDRSIRFYRNVFGAELLYVGDSDTQGVPLKMFQNVVGIKGARLKYAFLRIGDTLIELICYISPRGARHRPKHNDVGTPHIAFRVEDVDQAYSALVKKGLKFLSPPVVVRAKRKIWTKGWKFAYLKGPDGEYLELFQELH